MDIGTVKRAAIVGGAPFVIVAAMLGANDAETPKGKHETQARQELASQDKRDPICSGVCDAGVPKDKGAWARVDWKGDGKPNHANVRGIDPLDEYEAIQRRGDRAIERGYEPPPFGEETESDAQARVLANCRAGFTDEEAPATGSGTMDCAELEEKAAEDAGEVSPSAPAAPASAPAASVTVSRVVDGDTIEVSPAVDGISDVRLIGIDTPETVDPGEEVEPYGPEASNFATEALTGQSVELEFGAERTDQYDRLLAYVYVGGEMFNEVLVEEGYAQAYPYEPNTVHEGRFASAQEAAKASGLGIWGLTLSEQCLLANRGNGIGEGSPEC